MALQGERELPTCSRWDTKRQPSFAVHSVSHNSVYFCARRTPLVQSHHLFEYHIFNRDKPIN